MTSTNKKIIIAFDNDYTVMDNNSFLFQIKTIQDPEKEKELIQIDKKGPFLYTYGIFLKELKAHNKTLDDLKKEVTKIPLAKGMKELFDYLSKNKDKYHVIIISSGNNFIVNTLLEHHGLSGIVDEVYTNKFIVSETGDHQVVPTHKHNCPHCDPCLCKMDQINLCIDKIGRENVSKIFWVADGWNDFCLCKGLGKDDITFARKGFTLEKRIIKEGGEDKMGCKVVYWEDAREIMNVIEKIDK